MDDPNHRPPLPGPVGLALQAVGVAVVALGGLELFRRAHAPRDVADEAAAILEAQAERLRRHGRGEG